MSHFSVLVITDEPPTEEHLTDVLLPWHEYECTGLENKYVVDVDCTDKVVASYEKEDVETKGSYPTLDDYAREYYGYEKRGDRYIHRTNPNRKWDWWQIGGRYRGRLLVRNSTRAVLGKPGVFDNDPLNDGGVDTCRRGNLDLDQMQKHAGERAGKDWDEIHAVVRGRPWPEKFEDVLARHGKENIEAARTEFWAQPVMQDFSKMGSMFGVVLDDYKVTREEYVERGRRRALSAFAVVKDGQWYERGEMGWWGIVHDEKDRNKWDEEFDRLIRDIPPEQWIAIVDCHI